MELDVNIKDIAKMIWKSYLCACFKSFKLDK